MPDVANSALRLLRRLLGSPTRSAGPYAGEMTALDGNTAVAVTEATVCESAGLGGSFPATTADLAWRTEQLRHGRNLLGTALGSQTAEGPRGALATALGLALGGVRATAFLSAPDLAGCVDLLAFAAGRRLPLVIHLDHRALAGHALANGSGHEACHLASDAGAFVLVAANVQEAVDLTLIARRVAEETLTPGLVAMDGDRTALALQEVRLPSPELVSEFLGAPGDDIGVPTTAQRLLFGERRRRVPRWHDPDRPVLLGALQTTESWGLGAAAGHQYLDDQVGGSLEDAVGRFRAHTARAQEPIVRFRSAGARVLLVACASTIETACAVAAHLRTRDRLRVGVLGVRCLRPFPGAALAEEVAAARQVLVLERLHTPLAGDPPLLREIKAALHAASEAADPAAAGRRPARNTKKRPRIRSVIYGLGGFPLRGADLIRLCREAPDLAASRVYLGMEFTPRTSDYPKRQVLLDRLRRQYPDVAPLGLSSPEPTPDLRPADAFTVAVHRRSGQLGEGFAAEAAAFLRGLLGPHLRSHPALFRQPLGSYCIDRFTLSPQQLLDPGDAMPVDLVVQAQDPAGTRPKPLLDHLEPHGALLVLGPEGAGTGLWQTLSPELRQALRGSAIALYAVAGSLAVSDDLLLGAVGGLLLHKGRIHLTARRLLASRKQQLARAGDPRLEVRLRDFEAGLAGVRQFDYRGLPAAEATDTPELEAPLSVRRLGKVDDSYDSLPRFWDQVGVLYQDGTTAQLAPDPYMALGAVPPLLSAFRDLSPLRSRLPRLDPSLCTGCGRCWSQCPDGAWGAAAAPAGEVLEALIPAAEAGPLRPLAGKLAARIEALCRTWRPDSGDRVPGRGVGGFGALLRAAYAGLKEDTPIPNDRRPLLDAAADRLAAASDPLPAAVAAPFFDAANRTTPLDPGLLFLALDPNECKGCGICVRACPTGALRSVPQTAAELAYTRTVRKAWERLPATPAALIDRAAADPQVGPLPATLLAPAAARALAGGDGAEAGSGERLALRLTLALAESRQGPMRALYAEEVRETREEITALIRTVLADALPADDLDALARRLEGVSTRHAELGAFLGQAEDIVKSPVDAARLRRLVDLAQGLSELAWRLAEGHQGLGRAGIGLALAPGEVASWAGAFPHNSFHVPVTLDATGDGARLAAGLLEGQLRQAIEGFVLLRRARLELDKPMDAVRLWSPLGGLTWHDLTPKERERCPLLLLIGSNRMLAGAGLGQVFPLLCGDLPLKVLIFADLDLGLSTRAELDSPQEAQTDAATDLGLLALAARDAYIAQTSPAAPTHFLTSLTAGLAFPGPALFHVHTPSPGRHGFPPDRTLEQALLALTSRSFPLFRYDPARPGVFGSRIDLAGNPEPLARWAAAVDDQGAEDAKEQSAGPVPAAKFAPGGEASPPIPGSTMTPDGQGPAPTPSPPGGDGVGADDAPSRRATAAADDPASGGADPPQPDRGAADLRPLGRSGAESTPADFALREARFRHWLEPLGEDAPDPLPLADYLELPERERPGRTPYVIDTRTPDATDTPAPDGRRRLRVAPELVAVCRRRRDAWQLLQELAGLVTPFTERIRQDAREEVAADHRAALAAQAADYEHRLAGLRAALEQEFRGDVRDRLMALAGYRHQSHARPLQ